MHSFSSKTILMWRVLASLKSRAGEDTTGVLVSINYVAIMRMSSEIMQPTLKNYTVYNRRFYVLFLCASKKLFN